MANANEHSKHAHATKRGPGRYHSDGHQKVTPIPPRGAVGMKLHKASAAKKERRELVRTHGRRQAIKAIKYWRAEDRYAKKLEADEQASYVAPDAVDFA